MDDKSPLFCAKASVSSRVPGKQGSSKVGYPLLFDALLLLSIYNMNICGYVCCLTKNQNAPRPSEHPPVRGEKMSLFVVYLTLFTNPL